MPTSPGPDFLVIGAPSTGAEPLFAALGAHPQISAGSGDPEPGRLHGELAPFTLGDPETHRLLAESVAPPKLIAVVRNPVDRAYSHWQQLRAAGLEPEAEFLRAVELADERLSAGWSQEFGYTHLGRYGEQLAHLYEHIAPRRTMILRYRDLLDTPRITVDRACDFLGIDTGLAEVAADQVACAHAPAADREALLPLFEDDIRRLRKVTGQDFSDWLEPVPTSR